MSLPVAYRDVQAILARVAEKDRIRCLLSEDQRIRTRVFVIERRAQIKNYRIYLHLAHKIVQMPFNRMYGST